MIDLCTIFSRNWALPSFQHPSRDSAFSVCESLDHHTNAIHLGHQALSLAPHSSLSKVVTVVTLERAATVLAAPKAQSTALLKCMNCMKCVRSSKNELLSVRLVCAETLSAPPIFNATLLSKPQLEQSKPICLSTAVYKDHDQLYIYIYIIWTCTHQFWHTIKSNVYQNGSPNGMAVLGHQWWGHHAFEATT